ncbi:hypothetical protein BYT27DRAFT_7209586 [Phlegmacium glaucopus]|nr:hypothetical protein BYT27DRAFT_7209586 [Phlegmacium glaucopus]
MKDNGYYPWSSQIPPTRYRPLAPPIQHIGHSGMNDDHGSIRGRQTSVSVVVKRPRSNNPQPQPPASPASPAPPSTSVTSVISTAFTTFLHPLVLTQQPVPGHRCTTPTTIPKTPMNNRQAYTRRRRRLGPRFSSSYDETTRYLRDRVQEHRHNHQTLRADPNDSIVGAQRLTTTRDDDGRHNARRPQAQQ